MLRKNAEWLETTWFPGCPAFFAKFYLQKIGVDEEMFVVYNTNVIRFNIYVTY